MYMANQKNTDASLKNLDIQMGQLAKQIVESQKGKFTANSKSNPKEHCKEIFTASGKVVGRDVGEVVIEQEDSDVKKEKMSDNEEIEIEVLKNKSEIVNKRDQVCDSGEKTKAG